jgi:hypothetical protein
VTHRRELIRDAIALIIGQVPALTGKVVTTRTRPTEPKELPLAIIYTLNETSRPFSIGATLERTLNVGIEIRITAATAIDTALDVLCQAVEQAMAAKPKLGGRAMRSSLASTVVGLDGEGENRQALATLTYTVVYQTDATGA